MGEVLKKFGRYFLLDHVAQGGMAEIYRARLASLDGAGRLIVIKRIQAGYGSNNEFLQMFKSEIKVTMGFNHPNIVQLYDFGEEQNQPYIAMEFVDGRNLRQFLTRYGEMKQTLPVDLAAYIISQAANGLHYAHAFKDKLTGNSLSIVHRDISPQNILISYEGHVKVIDFGIAKATTNSEATRAGVIKGKPSYLSPEQIAGEPLDGRCDIFALGIVFWELLTGKKLFAGESDLAVLKLIESCNSHVKAPSTLNPKVPKELDYIVLKALAKQRDARYQTAEEMSRAIHRFLQTSFPDFSPNDVSYVAKDLFKNEIVEDRKLLQRLNEKAEQLLTVEPVPSPVKGENRARGEEETTTIAGVSVPRSAESSGARTLETEPAKDVRVEIEAKPASSKIQNDPRSRATGPASFPKGNDRPVAPPRGPSPPPRNQIPVSTSSKKSGGLVRILVPAAALAAIVLLGPEFGIRIPGLDLTGKIPEPQRNPQQEHAIEVPSGKTIPLRLTLIPGSEGANVALNGRPVDLNDPVIVVNLDAPLELIAERPGFRLLKREFTIDSRQLGGLKEWPMDVQMEPERFGYLTLRTTPSAEKVYFNGEKWYRGTPFENEKVPIGTYTIRLINEVLGMETTLENIVIQEGKAVTRDAPLEVKN